MTSFAKSGPFSLNLRSQGLLLVGALLIMELAFLGSFWRILQVTENEAQREAHSKETLARMQKMFRLVYDGGVAFDFYASAANKETKDRLFNDIAQIREILNWLRSEASDDAREKSILAHIELEMDRTSQIVKSVARDIEAKSPDAAEQQIENAKKGLHEVQVGLIAEAQELLRNQTQIALESPVAQRKAREKLKTLLMAAIPLNLILAIFLGVFFTRSITSRLNILVENTELLQKRQPLNPTIAGSDEISQLDTTFHSMASALIRDEGLLKDSEARVRKIIDSVPIGLIILNKQGKIEFVNPRTESMFGSRAADLIGLPVLNLFARGENGSDALTPLFASSHSDGSQTNSAVIEVKAVRHSQTQFPAEVSVTEFTSSEGERRLVTVMDVTERHEILKLRQAFVAMVSHELRTPLTSIRGFFSLLDMGAYGQLTDEAQDGAKRAETNVVRLITLINDLLDLERMESGSFSIAAKPVSVAAIVQQSLDVVQLLAEQKQIKIETSIEPLTVDADSDRIVQVLVNLLSNAIKFSPSGGRVETKVCRRNSSAEFRVADEGRGIPDQFLSSIFERFQQVEEADATKRGGSGLGLPISKAIVDKHGGSIYVESQPGRGSTFIFLLPLTASN